MVLYGKGTDMNRMLQITMLLLLAAGVALGAEAKSATLLLQEGIYAEETEGNLDKAIGIYQEAAQSAAVTEKAAAEAVFRTGMCYLKKGDKTAAQKQFQLVVTKYSSQTALVAQAQKQLSALGVGAEPELPQDVKNYIVAQQMKHCVEADAKHIAANGVVWGVDSDLNLYAGGMTIYKNTTGKTVGGEIRLTGTSYPTLMGVDGEGLRVVKSNKPGPQYQVYWTPNPAVGPNDVRIVGWRVPGGKKLTAAVDGKTSVTMQNQYGPEVIESFYVLIPHGMKIVSPVPATFQAEFSDTDVYEWTRQVAKNTNNKLTVQLSGANVVPAKPLEIGAAPWMDGEISKLLLKTKSDMTIGALYYMPHLVKDGGRDIWQLDSFLFVTMQESRQFTRVQADVATMAPIAGRTMNQLGDFMAAYDKDKVTLSTTTGGKTNTRDVAVSGPVFDNEEVLMLIRRLPLAEGYATTFQIFTVQGGQAVECQINVDGKEDITVPFGTAPCWKVKLSVYSGPIKALEHTLWFSADEKKLLMKYDSGTVVMELAEVSKVQPQTVISDSKTGISITLPAGWVACTDGAATERRLSWPIANDEMETWSTFIAQESPGSADLNAAVDGDIEVLKGFFKEYTVRPDSRKSLSVNEMPAMTFAADYTNEGKAMVEYRTYIMGKGRIYWFVFRVEKDKFQANQAIYDGIVSSFAVAGK